MGGHYPCVGCDAKSSTFDDLAYCYHANCITLEDRRTFILNGASWKRKKINPLNDLRIADLRCELQTRGISTCGKKRVELDKELLQLQKGISNIPALLQPTPEMTLSSAKLENYEVCPTEPLHDLKGHFSALITAASSIAEEEVSVILNEVKESVLNKNTLRCSDYRKAIVTIYTKLEKCTSQSLMTELFRTATEISRLMYAHDTRRTPKAILRLHNTVLLHANTCLELFTRPEHKQILHSRFSHSIVCHSPLIFRLVSLRSINAEAQERVFGQMKQITKATSNNHPNNVITNVLIRMKEEGNSKNTNTLETQESEVRKIAKTLGKSKNSVIPFTWCRVHPTQYQAHLEKISDFIACGEGIWWKVTSDGFEFFDGDDCDDYHKEGPLLQHFRSSTLPDIHSNLRQKWQQCLQAGINLPAEIIRHYTDAGQFSHFSTHSCSTKEPSLTLSQGQDGQVGPSPLTLSQGQDGQVGPSPLTLSQGQDGQVGPSPLTLSQGQDGQVGPSPLTLSQGQDGHVGPSPLTLSQGQDGQVGPSPLTLSQGQDGQVGPSPLTLSQGQDGQVGPSPLTLSQGQDGQVGPSPLTLSQGQDGQVGPSPLTLSQGQDGQVGPSPLTLSQGQDGQVGPSPLTLSQGQDGQVGPSPLTLSQGQDGQVGPSPLTLSQGQDGQVGPSPLTLSQGQDGQVGLSPLTLSQGQDGQVGPSPLTLSQGQDGHVGPSPLTLSQGQDGHVGPSPLTLSQGQDGHVGPSPLTLSQGQDGHVGLSPLTLSQGQDGHVGLSPLTLSQGQDGHVGLSPLTLSQGQDGQVGPSPLTLSQGQDGHVGLSPLTLSQGQNSQVGPSFFTLSVQQHSQVRPSPLTPSQQSGNQIGLSALSLSAQNSSQPVDLQFPQQGSTYTSSLVRSLTQVLPDNDVLKQFDHLRSCVKTKQKVSNTKKRHLARLSKQIKTLLIQRFNELSITKREKQKIRTIQKILQHEWKVDINLLN